MKIQWKQNTFALLAAMIWGTAFVAQSVSSDAVEPFTFNASRSWVSVAVLGAFLLLRRLLGKAPKGYDFKQLLLGGAICGTFLCIAANLQQAGIGENGAGKSGFITALYIVLVPVLGLALKRKAPFTVWIAVVIAVAGLYCLCVTGAFTVSAGDFYLLLCALMFACQILAVDHFSEKTDGVALSFAQFLTVAILSTVLTAVFDTPDPQAILSCALPILYVGIFSGGVAYTLQILAQKGSNPTVVALIMSLEAFFSVVAGALVLQEVLTVREYVGCLLMLIAVAVAQVPVKQKV